MKFYNILIIIAVCAVLGVAGIFLTPEKLTTEEENKAIQNRKEIIKSLEGVEGDTALLDDAMARERKESKHIDDSINELK